jgi:hypothetical protein
METLNLSQMELVSGGRSLKCAISVAVMVAAGASLFLPGPGWAFAASSASYLIGAVDAGLACR